MMSGEIEFGTRIEGIQYRDRPGVYALILDADKNIALVKIEKGYFLPGGGLEGDETHEEGLKRECAEELGYNIEVGKFIGRASNYIASRKSNEYLRVIGSFYRAQLLEQNGLKSEQDHELVWMKPEDAVGKMYAQFQSWAIKSFLELQRL